MTPAKETQAFLVWPKLPYAYPCIPSYSKLIGLVYIYIYIERERERDIYIYIYIYIYREREIERENIKYVRYHI